MDSANSCCDNKTDISNLYQATRFHSIWSVGSGSSGLLLNNSLDDSSVFKKVNLKDILRNMEINNNEDNQKEGQLSSAELTSIEMDGNSAYAVLSSGNVYHFGEYFSEAQKNKISLSPRLIQSLLGFQIVKVACGWSHALFLDKHNKVFGSGSNKFGEIGMGKEKDKKLFCDPEPIKIHAFIEDQDCIVDIICGFRQSFIVAKGRKHINESANRIQPPCSSPFKSTRIWCTGSNKSSELGGFKDQALIYEFTENVELVGKIKGTCSKMICGAKFVCALNTECATLYGWGDNRYGQLRGEPKVQEDPIEIAQEVKDASSGWHHLLILKNDGFLYTIGRGDLGQLGNKSFVSSASLVRVQVTKDFQRFDLLREILFTKGIEGDIDVMACGSEANYVKTSTSIYSWGWNEHGNLGTGTQENVSEPTPVKIFDQDTTSSHKDINKIISGGAVCYLVQEE